MVTNSYHGVPQNDLGAKRWLHIRPKKKRFFSSFPTFSMQCIGWDERKALSAYRKALWLDGFQKFSQQSVREARSTNCEVISRLLEKVIRGPFKECHISERMLSCLAQSKQETLVFSGTSSTNNVRGRPSQPFITESVFALCHLLLLFLAKKHMLTKQRFVCSTSHRNCSYRLLLHNLCNLSRLVFPICSLAPSTITRTEWQPTCKGEPSLSVQMNIMTAHKI